MTSVVAIRCTDGVVVGADSAITFGAAGGHIGTIEQHTSQKLRIIDESIIVAGTGDLGMMQRFARAIEKANARGDFSQIVDAIEYGKMLSRIGHIDFAETHLNKFDFSAFVAFTAGGEASLCEIDGGSGFQPEIKEPSDLWYVSAGAGQAITDPFLALLREAFWVDGPPNLRGGIFTALWALTHVCEINTGGIGGPIKMAVLEKPKNGQPSLAHFLSTAELDEHKDAVQAAVKHLGQFKLILNGQIETETVPLAAANSAKP